MSSLASASGRRPWGYPLVLPNVRGLGIFLISHDIHDVFDLADRISVMLTGKLVGTVRKDEVTKDEVLAMIIMGKLPADVTTAELEELRS